MTPLSPLSPVATLLCCLTLLTSLWMPLHLFPSLQRVPPCFENQINPHSVAIIPACSLPYSLYSHSFLSTPVQAFFPPSSSMHCLSASDSYCPRLQAPPPSQIRDPVSKPHYSLFSTGSGAATLQWLDYKARRGGKEVVRVSTPVSRVPCFIRNFDHSLRYGSAFFWESKY